MSTSQGTAARRARSSTNSPHHQSGKHSDPLRGLMSAATSPLFQGRFGRMFRFSPSAQFGSDEDENKKNLKILAEAMSATADPQDPKDGPDDEESGIPALYTYFGQFVDHDITFDPASSLQKQNDPDALIDYRTPALDLDNVYGRGPSDQPYLYTDPPKHETAKHFLLGDPIQGGNSSARDLPRNHANPARALIGDPRNDENAIVSQLQGLFLRFHNRTATDNPHLKFEEVQQLVRFHYQYVVLHDFLPRLVHSTVLAELKSGQHYHQDKLKFFRWKNEPYMPVEFSVAAYRLGHSMVRPGYRLNDAILKPIFDNSGDDLRGFQPLKPGFGMDWARFIDTEIRKYDGSENDKKKRLQFAYRIDTSLVNPLSKLPRAVVSDAPASLAQRNLLRGWRLGLPSGQAVARAMGVKPLPDDKILLGKALDKPAPNEKPTPITSVNKVFADNCPLWTYILAEAMHHKEPVKIPVKENLKINTPRLGPVGGRIVAEVFLGLMFGDPNSMLRLDPNWQPKAGSNYALKDFVAYALG
jgi:Animal haem peroxidase